MKTIIAGSRTIDDYELVEQAVEECGWEITEVLSGTARGVDKLGERWAEEHGVPVSRYPADWERYGRSAGIRRNCVMAANADALIAVWDGSSKGTEHMMDTAFNMGLRLHQVSGQ